MIEKLSYFVVVSLAVVLARPAAGEIINHRHHSVQGNSELALLLWVSADLLNAAEPPLDFPVGLVALRAESS